MYLNLNTCFATELLSGRNETYASLSKILLSQHRENGNTEIRGIFKTVVS